MLKKAFISLLFPVALAGSSMAQNTFPATGNVGVGTTAPAYSLQVNSAAASQLGITRTGANTGIAIRAGLNNSSIQFLKTGTKHAGIVFDGTSLIYKGMSSVNDANPDLSAGTPEEVNHFFLGAIASSRGLPEGGFVSLINSSKTTATSARTWNIYNMTGSYGNSLQFWAYSSTATLGPRMVITDEGMVGVGTTSPLSQIHVASAHSNQFGISRVGASTGIQMHSGTQNSSIQFLKSGTKHAGIVFDGYSLIYKGMSSLNDNNPDLTPGIEENVNHYFYGALNSHMNSPEGGNLTLVNPQKTPAGAAKYWKIFNMTGAYGNSLQFWAYDDLNTISGPRFILHDNGGARLNGNLEASGTVLAGRVKVAVPGSANWNFAANNTGNKEWQWADYVFDEHYPLKPLHEVETFIQQNKHLPGIPTTEQVKKDGIDLGEMNAKLLEKVEELTLYLIQLKKMNDGQNEKINALQKQLDKIKK